MNLNNEENELCHPSVSYKKKLIKNSCDISYDAAWSLLSSSDKILKNYFSGSCNQVSPIFCAKCSAPWLAGYYTIRLISHSYNKKTIKNLLKNRKFNRLTQKNKMLLSAYENNCNILKVTCKLCSFTQTSEYKKLQNIKEIYEINSNVLQANIPNDSDNLIKKKKKKKKSKDINAGLLLDEKTINSLGTQYSESKKMINNNSYYEDNRSFNNSSKCSIKNDNYLHKNLSSNHSLKDSIKNDSCMNINLNSYNSEDKKLSDDKKHLLPKMLKRKKLQTSSIGETKQKGKMREKNKSKLKEVIAGNLSISNKRPTTLASFLNTLI